MTRNRSYLNGMRNPRDGHCRYRCGAGAAESATTLSTSGTPALLNFAAGGHMAMPIEGILCVAQQTTWLAVGARYC